MSAQRIEARTASDGGNADVAGALVGNLDLWTSAVTYKSSAGRGSNGKLELTGIKKLRELILELAVRGKLVPQDPNDEPASELLKRIEAKKARLVKEGKIKKPKKLPEVSEDEKRIELPNGWEWLRIGSFAVVKGGKRLPKGHTLVDYDTGDAYIRVTDMKNGSVKIVGLQYLLPETKELIKQYTISSKDLYITIAGTIGSVGVVPVALDGANLTENAAKIVIALVNQSWLKLALESGFVQSQLLDKVNQMAQPKLALHRIESTALAIPPILEQHRIVEKVDELMALCDHLEQQTCDQNSAHETLVDALLDTLVQAKDAAELADNWSRLAVHFDTLFTTEHSIERLKQTILQLAVMGRLVPQDPHDEPASELLNRITSEKARLVKEGEIKRSKTLRDVSEEVTPYDLPEQWAWCRFGNVWVDSFYGPRFGKEEYVSSGGYPTIRTTDMTDQGRIALKSPPLVKIERDKYEVYGLKKGDLLVTRSGSIGAMAIFDLEVEAIPSAYLIRLRILDAVSSKYTMLFLQSPYGQNLLGLSTTSVAVPNVNASNMAGFLFPLPPVAEQQRIIAKVDELIALCDQFKARLSQANETRCHLAEAVVEQAVAS